MNGLNTSNLSPVAKHKWALIPQKAANNSAYASKGLYGGENDYTSQKTF